MSHDGDGPQCSNEPKRIDDPHWVEQGRINMLGGCFSQPLPLPDPFPDYVTCPHCGEPEVEVWCYEEAARCHHCGGWIAHTPQENCRIYSYCSKKGKSESA